MYVKIKSEKIRECKYTDWKETLVLEIEYKIKNHTWIVNIKDYNKYNYKAIIKSAKHHIKEWYKKFLEEQETPLQKITI